MVNTDFDYCIDDYMVYCHSRQLREKTMSSYEQTLRLFERWCAEEMKFLFYFNILNSIFQNDVYKFIS